MENKSSKYLKYAIGEIVLVVIGILIALQINNWNENRKDQLLENTYLIRLTQDLKKDLLDLDTEINKRMDKAEVAKKKTLDLAGVDYKLKRNIKEEEMDPMIYGWSQFYPNNNTYLDLLSTGNLNLIKDDSIKNALLELNKQWLALDREYKTINDFRINWLIDRNNELSDNISSYSVALSNTDKEVKLTEDQLINFIEKASNADKLLNNDTKYRNGMATEILLNNAIINFLRNYKNQVENLLKYMPIAKSNLSL